MRQLIVLRMLAVATLGYGQTGSPVRNQVCWYLARLFSPENLPNILLFLVGVGGTIIAIRSLKAVERQAKVNEGALTEIRAAGLQTDRLIEENQKQAEAAQSTANAAEKSAAATLANAMAIREAERAWLVEQVHFPNHIPTQSEMQGGVMQVTFSLKNIGKQPAFIKLVQARFHTTQQLQDKPEYRRIEPMNGILIAPGETKYVAEFLEEASLDDDKIARVRRPQGERLYLYAYGCVIYESAGIRGCNQFCYRWHDTKGISFVGDKEEFRKEGPTEYNKHT